MHMIADDMAGAAGQPLSSPAAFGNHWKVQSGFKMVCVRLYLAMGDMVNVLKCSSIMSQ